MQLTSEPPAARRTPTRPPPLWRGATLSPRAYTVDLGTLHLPPRAIDALAACTDTPADVRTKPDAVARVSALLTARAPIFAELAEDARLRLERRTRIVVLRGFGTHTLPAPIRDALILGFSNLVAPLFTSGETHARLLHDARGGWPEPHTELAHVATPPRYATLWCTSGKLSARLIDARAALRVLEGASDSEQMLEMLRGSRLPFCSPTNADQRPAEVTRASIVGDGPLVRVSPHALEEGLRITRERMAPRTRQAIDALDRAIRTPGLSLAITLMPGDALLINNHEILQMRAAEPNESLGFGVFLGTGDGGRETRET